MCKSKECYWKSEKVTLFVCLKYFCEIGVFLRKLNTTIRNKDVQINNLEKEKERLENINIKDKLKNLSVNELNGITAYTGI